MANNRISNVIEMFASNYLVIMIYNSKINLFKLNYYVNKSLPDITNNTIQPRTP